MPCHEYTLLTTNGDQLFLIKKHFAAVETSVIRPKNNV